MTIFWSPSEHASKKTQMAHFMDHVNRVKGTHFQDYPSFHAWSVNNPGEFWLEFWRWCDIKCKSQPDVAFVEGEKMQDALWMGGATFNFAENLLSRKDEKLAIHFTSEQGETASLTYAQLWKQVASLAQYLRDEGISTGDRVCAMVPNYHLTVVCMLAVTSVGAVWCSCSPDFGVDALAMRFRQVSPLMLIAVDGHCYNGKSFKHIAKIAELQKKLSSIRTTLVLPYLDADPSPLEDAVSYEQIMQNYAQVEDIEFEYLPFSHPVYILFSSGTTGKPKCMVHGAGGTLLQHLKEHRLHCDIRPQERLFFYTTCGWMMWNWSVSVLAAEGTLMLFDGSPFFPKETILFDLVDQHKINVLGLGAKYLEVCASKELAPKKTHSLSSLRMILTTGSPLLPNSYDYVESHIKSSMPLCSISGGSDIISCFFLANPLLPIYRGELQGAGLGMNMKVFNEQGESVLDEKGELVCVTPFPSMPVCFWSDHDGARYQAAYFDRFPDVWAHGDYALIHPTLSAIIFGRSDATLNPGGVRIGTSEIYAVLAMIEEVVESVAVGQSWNNDERIVLFVVLKEGVKLSKELVQTIKETLRVKLSPKHVPAVVLEVPELPKTVNGKLVEIVVKNIVNGQEVGNTSTLENPACLEAFKNRAELN